VLELDEVQHFLLARPRALAARYGFLTFREPASGRAWLSGIIDKVGTGRVVGSGGVIHGALQRQSGRELTAVQHESQAKSTSTCPPLIVRTSMVQHKLGPYCRMPYGGVPARH